MGGDPCENSSVSISVARVVAITLAAAASVESASGC